MGRSLSRSCMLRCTRRHSYFCIWVLVAVAVIRRSREPWFEKRRSAYIMVDMCASACGLGNQMFRYAAWRSLAGQYPNRSACVLWDPGLLAAHPHSALAQHVEGVERAETCLWTDAATVRFEPPHSIYRPFPALTDGRDIVLSGCMQSFRYFEGRLRAPIFRLKQQEAARLWLAEHGLTSVVHVRRGDKLADGSVVVPLAYYEAALRRIGTSRVAVCTDRSSVSEFKGESAPRRECMPMYTVSTSVTERLIARISKIGVTTRDPVRLNIFMFIQDSHAINHLCDTMDRGIRTISELKGTVFWR